MDYKKTNWTNTTPINTTNLNKIEQGIYDNSIANVYSEEEQVIGVWIDGKPLYRKIYTTYVLEEGSSTDSYILEIDVNKNIKYSYGLLLAKRNDKETYKLTLGSGDVGFGTISNVMQNNTSGAIYVSRTHGAYANTYGMEVIVYYTKNN